MMTRHCLTGDRSMDNLNEHVEAGKKELLVVSFGTASPESRRLNIDATEDAIKAAAGDAYNVCRAFTSQMIINIIRKREGIIIDNLSEALERAAESGVSHLVVQPLHLTKGLEYDKIRTILTEYEDRFAGILLGEPLLSSEEDISMIADALIGASDQYDDGRTAVVFMGHGTSASANDVYVRIQEALSARGKSNYYIGTAEASPSLDDVIASVNRRDYTRAVLRPLMLTAGNHALNDMSSADDPDSWYSRFTAAGYETVCIIEGLGQIPAVRDIYVSHAMKAAALF